MKVINDDEDGSEEARGRGKDSGLCFYSQLLIKLTGQPPAHDP
jgi:hypothetical protein